METTQRYDGVTAALNEVADALYRLGREWEAAGELIQADDFARYEAWVVAMEKAGYPLGRDIDELQAEVADYAERVIPIMAAHLPEPMAPAAATIRDQVGRPNMLAALLGTDEVAGPLADLLDAASRISKAIPK